jgi:hypothetical protein
MARNPVVTARMAAELEGEFVVFLIGMRVNRLWKLHRWVPVAREMGPMMAELMRHPELGLLGYRTVIADRGPMVVQYWRSAEQLMAFARDADNPHLDAWRRFNRRVASNGDVGIWHETFVVQPGNYEAFYGNMPRVGLAAAGEHVPVARRGESARARLAKTPAA